MFLFSQHGRGMAVGGSTATGDTHQPVQARIGVRGGARGGAARDEPCCGRSYTPTRQPHGCGGGHSGDRARRQPGGNRGRPALAV